MRSLVSASVVGSAATLDDWQKHLEAHFAALAKTRRAKDLPVFAIEHGLGSDERSNLGKLLNRSLGGREQPGQFWLVLSESTSNFDAILVRSLSLYANAHASRMFSLIISRTSLSA
jgi:hypothetical protein